MASQLHIEISGPRSGPALVLIHPVGGNTRFWDDCVSHWLLQYHIVAYDLRGDNGDILYSPCQAKK